MALTVALAVSKRLQLVAAAVLCLALAQFAVASCSPEPAPYAARTAAPG